MPVLVAAPTMRHGFGPYALFFFGAFEHITEQTDTKCKIYVVPGYQKKVFPEASFYGTELHDIDSMTQHMVFNWGEILVNWRRYQLHLVFLWNHSTNCNIINQVQTFLKGDLQRDDIDY